MGDDLIGKFLAGIPLRFGEVWNFFWFPGPGRPGVWGRWHWEGLPADPPRMIDLRNDRVSVRRLRGSVVRWHRTVVTRNPSVIYDRRMCQVSVTDDGAVRWFDYPPYPPPDEEPRGVVRDFLTDLRAGEVAWGPDV